MQIFLIICKVGFLQTLRTSRNFWPEVWKDPVVSSSQWARVIGAHCYDNASLQLTIVRLSLILEIFIKYYSVLKSNSRILVGNFTLQFKYSTLISLTPSTVFSLLLSSISKDEELQNSSDSWKQLKQLVPIFFLLWVIMVHYFSTSVTIRCKKSFHLYSSNSILHLTTRLLASVHGTEFSRIWTIPNNFEDRKLFVKSLLTWRQVVYAFGMNLSPIMFPISHLRSFLASRYVLVFDFTFTVFKFHLLQLLIKAGSKINNFRL